MYDFRISFSWKEKSSIVLKIIFRIEDPMGIALIATWFPWDLFSGFHC